MTTFKRALTRAGVVAAASGVAILLGAATAAAHVTIKPDNTASGSYSKLTVRVPNESTTAGTVQVQLDLPTDVPFPSVRVQPRDGWTAELTTTTFDEPVTVGDYTLGEAVTSVTWTADSGVQIGQGEFDEFAISVGPLPEPGTYYFPAVQTYSDGEVVTWDAEPVEGEGEPERPAPELTVVEATAEDTGETSDTGGTSDTLARGVGVGGVVIGATGLGVGALALRRRSAANA